MKQMSISFCMGNGNIAHNYRNTKGRGIRQNGIMERRFINEYGVNTGNGVEIVKDVSGVESEELIKKIVAEEVSEALAKLNEKQIASGHPERVKTLEQWMEAQQYVKGGNRKKIISEFVIQVGDKFSGIPYIPETDNEGNMLTRSGMRIPEWDTRKVPAYRRNKIVESKISKELKVVYREFVKEFEKRNPCVRVIGYGTHGDEGGGVHCHVMALFVGKTKNGTGVCLSKTTALKQMYAERGIKTKETRKDNAQNLFRQEMRDLLEEICNKHGIARLDMHNKEKHRSNKEYGRFSDRRCEAMERRENDLKVKEFILDEREQVLKEKEAKLKKKEEMLASDIVKQEWHWLRTQHKEWYKIIHEEYQKKIKENKNVLDKRTNVLYDRSVER